MVSVVGVVQLWRGAPAGSCLTGGGTISWTHRLNDFWRPCLYLSSCRFPAKAHATSPVVCLLTGTQTSPLTPMKPGTRTMSQPLKTTGGLGHLACAETQPTFCLGFHNTPPRGVDCSSSKFGKWKPWWIVDPWGGGLPAGLAGGKKVTSCQHEAPEYFSWTPKTAKMPIFGNFGLFF